jgi:hypothetical protein
MTRNWRDIVIFGKVIYRLDWLDFFCAGVIVFIIVLVALK